MDSKPLTPLQARTLECLLLKAHIAQLHAEVVALKARQEVAALQEEYTATVQSMAAEAGLEGWIVDMEQQQWVKPEERLSNGRDTHA